MAARYAHLDNPDPPKRKTGGLSPHEEFIAEQLKIFQRMDRKQRLEDEAEDRGVPVSSLRMTEAPDTLRGDPLGYSGDWPRPSLTIVNNEDGSESKETRKRHPKEDVEMEDGDKKPKTTTTKSDSSDYDSDDPDRPGRYDSAVLLEHKRKRRAAKRTVRVSSYPDFPIGSDMHNLVRLILLAATSTHIRSPDGLFNKEVKDLASLRANPVCAGLVTPDGNVPKDDSDSLIFVFVELVSKENPVIDYILGAHMDLQNDEAMRNLPLHRWGLCQLIRRPGAASQLKPWIDTRALEKGMNIRQVWPREQGMKMLSAEKARSLLFFKSLF